MFWKILLRDVAVAAVPAVADVFAKDPRTQTFMLGLREIFGSNLGNPPITTCPHCGGDVNSQ